ncbi:MAG: hypothetical protein KAV00_10505 [Phycisphaerae bacterium]|nr:hypothetical protein [Phycisphaerae bacterium]
MKAEKRLLTQLNGICESVATLASATNHAKELSAKADVKGLDDEERRHTAKRLEIVVESLRPITEDLSKLQTLIAKGLPKETPAKQTPSTDGG